MTVLALCGWLFALLNTFSFPQEIQISPRHIEHVVSTPDTVTRFPVEFSVRVFSFQPQLGVC